MNLRKLPSEQDSLGQIGRNYLIAILIAVTTWMVCSSLRWGIVQGTNALFKPFEHEHLKNVSHAFHTGGPALVLLLVLLAGGLIRGYLIRRDDWQGMDGDGVEESIEYFHIDFDEEHESQSRYTKPTFLSAFKRWCLTLLTLATGGSGGLEGPMLPIGEAIGAGWSKIFGVIRSNDLRAMQMSGIAAGITTLLNAPFAGAIFAAEVVFTEKIVYRTLFFSLIAAVVAYELNNHFLHFQPIFSIAEHDYHYSLYEYMEVVFVAVFCSAPAGFGLRFIFHRLNEKMRRVPIGYRASMGALAAGLLALGMWWIFGIEPNHILGMGENSLQDVLYGTGNPLLTVWWVLFLIVFVKVLATGFTLMSGGSAGLLIPAMVMGGLTGLGVSQLLMTLGIPLYQESANLFAVAGIASALVAVVEVPLASIALVMELFGAKYAPAAIVACVVCHMLAKRFQVYADAMV